MQIFGSSRLRSAQRETWLELLCALWSRSWSRHVRLVSGGDTTGKGSGKGSSGDLDGLLNQLSDIKRKLERIEKQVNNGGNGSTDKRIDTIIKRLGAVLNHLDAKLGSALSEGDAAMMSTQVEELIDLLIDAQEAEV